MFLGSKSSASLVGAQSPSPRPHCVHGALTPPTVLPGAAGGEHSGKRTQHQRTAPHVLRMLQKRRAAGLLGCLGAERAGTAQLLLGSEETLKSCLVFLWPFENVTRAPESPL